MLTVSCYDPKGMSSRLILKAASRNPAVSGYPVNWAGDSKQLDILLTRAFPYKPLAPETRTPTPWYSIGLLSHGVNLIVAK